MYKLKSLKKGLLILTAASLMSMLLSGGEKRTYPTDGKGDKILGYRKLENSFGITTSHEGNTVYVNKGGDPVERVFGATEDGKQKIEVMKGNTVIVNGGVLASNGYWEEKEVKEIRGGSVYGAAGQISEVTGNTVVIKGDSVVEGNVYGGYSHRGSATNNRVTIEDSPKFGPETVLYGGRGSRNVRLKEDKVTLAPSDVVTGNTLEIRTKNVTVKNVKNFEKFIFSIALDKIKSKERLLILTNSIGVQLDRAEAVKVSSKLEASDAEKDRIFKQANRGIDAGVDVVFQKAPSRDIKNLKIVLINAEAGLSLEKLPENISRNEKGYRYEVRFEKDAKNLYAVINVKKK